MSENILVTVSEDDHKISVSVIGAETPLMVMTPEQATEMARLFLQGAELARRMFEAENGNGHSGLQRRDAEDAESVER